MSPDQITGIIRAALAAIGGFILAKGWVNEATWAWLVGGITTIVPLVWSTWSNRPAGIAGAAQALPGVNVVTTAQASPAVTAAVEAAKQVVTWAEIILLALKVINAIMGEVGSARSFNAGVDAEIAKVSAAILSKTLAGKKIMERVDAMSADEVDAGLRDLEPK